MGSGALSRPWRLIVSPPASGAWNMAVDEALAESVKGGALPVLRFYSWEPGTLSLGRFQNPHEGLTEAAFSLPRVRRPTGGGAIWHENELTYSLACTREDLGTGDVKASFEMLCGFLLNSWRDQGWKACFAKDLGGRATALGEYTPACFAGQEQYDIVVEGKKLGGNAQRRDRGVILQHGSLPLKLDHQRLAQIFLSDDRPDAASITDLESCGWSGTVESLISVLVASFESVLQVRLTDSALSEAEATAIPILVEQKFGSADWTENGSGRLR